MKRAGKISPLILGGVVGVVALLALIFLMQTTDSAGLRVDKFLTALGKADVNGIMATSTFGDEPAEAVRAKWQKCLDRTKYYRFYWQVKLTSTTSPDEGNVTVDMYKDAGNIQTYPSKVQIPVVRINGEWYVDARAIDRESYPALPR